MRFANALLSLVLFQTITASAEVNPHYPPRPARIVTGAGPGGGPHVRAFSSAQGTQIAGNAGSFLAYGSGFSGGVSVASGDVNGDEIPDTITGAGPGGGPHVRIFDGATGEEIRGFFAYHPLFTGGVSVAAGDVNNDGKADIVTGPGAGGVGPNVRVFDGATGNEIASFMAFPSSYTGGIQVAAYPLDLSRRGFADIIVSRNVKPGVYPSSVSSENHWIRFFTLQNGSAFQRSSPSPIFGGSASSPRFGMSVAIGDLDGDLDGDLVWGEKEGRTPQVWVALRNGSQFSIPGSAYAMAYAASFQGGVRVGVVDADLDGRGDIITAPGPGGGPHVRVLSYPYGTDLGGFFAYAPSFGGGVFVAAPITVYPERNEIPVAQAGAFTTTEDVNVSGSLSASDADNDPLQFRRVSGPTKGTISIDPTSGFFVYSPDNHATGEDSFTFKVNDGIADSGTVTIAISITPVNDLPTTLNQDFLGTEDVALSGLLTVSDVDNDPLVFSIETQPTKGTVEIVSTEAGIEFRYQPAANLNGDDAFIYSVSDGVSTATGLVLITLTPVNDAPVVGPNRSVYTPHNTPLSRNLPAYDIDGPTPLTVIVVSPPAKGTVQFVGLNFTYTPNPGAVGQDSFTYRVSDGALESADAQLRVTIGSPP